MTRLCVKRLLVLCHVDPQVGGSTAGSTAIKILWKSWNWVRRPIGLRWFRWIFGNSTTLDYLRPIQLTLKKNTFAGFFFSHEILTSLTSLPCDFPKLVSAYQFPTRKPAPSTASWPFMGSDRTAVGSDNDVGMQDVYWQDDPLEIHIRDFFWWTYLFLRKYSHTELCKRCFMDQKDIHFFGLWLLTLRVFNKHLSDNATDFDRTIHACNKLCTRRATP